MLYIPMLAFLVMMLLYKLKESLVNKRNKSISQAIATLAYKKSKHSNSNVLFYSCLFNFCYNHKLAFKYNILLSCRTQLLTVVQVHF